MALLLLFLLLIAGCRPTTTRAVCHAFARGLIQGTSDALLECLDDAPRGSEP